MRHAHVEEMSRAEETPRGEARPGRPDPTPAGHYNVAAVVIRTSSAEETESLGERLARNLLERRPETSTTVFLLHGPLGAGKTCLVRGLARGLECPTVPRSPTFALHLTHEGRRVLHHLDLYRLDDTLLDDLGLEDLFSSPGVVAVEWGERVGALAPADAVHVRLDPDGDDLRTITVIDPRGDVCAS